MKMMNMSPENIEDLLSQIEVLALLVADIDEENTHALGVAGDLFEKSGDIPGLPEKLAGMAAEGAEMVDLMKVDGRSFENYYPALCKIVEEIQAEIERETLEEAAPDALDEDSLDDLLESAGARPAPKSPERRAPAAGIETRTAREAPEVTIDPANPELVEFAVEAREYLHAAESAAIALEKAPGAREHLDEIFRGFHNIKGISGFLNLKDVNELAHCAESLLNENITVGGSVQACEVVSGGDVVVKGGIITRHEGTVSAKGNASAKFIENSIVEAEKNVVADRAIINSSVRSNSCVVCVSREGRIMGGDVIAFQEIKARHLGTEKETKTVLRAGFKHDIFLKMAEIEKKLEDVVSEAESVQKNLLSPRAGQTEAVAELKKKLSALEADRTTLQQRLSALRSQEQVNPFATVKGEDLIHPGCRIYIDGTTIGLDDSGYRCDITPPSIVTGGNIEISCRETIRTIVIPFALSMGNMELNLSLLETAASDALPLAVETTVYKKIDNCSGARQAAEYWILFLLGFGTK